MMRRTEEKYSDGSIKYIGDCSKCSEPDSVYGTKSGILKKMCKECLLKFRQKNITKHKPQKTHGLSTHPLYERWKNMKARCYNPKNPRYSDWGGRGISVCEEWRSDFSKFLNHMKSLDGYGSRDLTMDRINNNKNYEPGNMKWSTISEQNYNQRHRKTNTGENKIKSETVGNYTRYRITDSNESFNSIESAKIARKELHGF